MPKIEEPKSISLFVQWELYPFNSSFVEEQKTVDTNSAVKRTTKHLNFLINEFPNLIKIIEHYNGKVQIIVEDPEIETSSQSKLWREIIETLIKSEEILSIEIFVNNDLSESIACNLGLKVRQPWRIGYKGKGVNNLIYHK